MSQTQQGDKRFLDLLQRWLRGDFRRGDERDLNSLAESDDFRREALEGFALFPGEAHEQSLQSLRFRLNAKTQNSGQRVFNYSRMLAAAAALVLVLAAVWFLPKIWSEQAAANSEIAQNQPLATEIQSAPIGDSTFPKSVENNLPQTSQSARSMKSSPKAGAENFPEGKFEELDKPTASKVERESEKMAGQSKDDVATIAEAKPAAEAMPEMEGVAVSPAKPSTAIRELPAASPAPAGSSADRLGDASPDMKNAPSANKPEQNAKKKHQTDSKPDLKKYRKQEPQLAESQPLGGWDAFRDYLAGNARLNDAARQNKITSATVIVQFSLDDKGEPENFSFKKRFGYGLDQEAVRLIKDFNWVLGKARELEVEVVFR